MKSVKNNSFYVVTLLATIISCRQKQEIKQTYFPDGKLESKIVVLSKDKGRYISYYKTGSIASEGELDGNLTKDGSWKYFYPDGRIAAFGDYDDELKVGAWTYKLKDTAFTIEWEKYINRPLKLNLPKGWIIDENITQFAPLTAYTDNDSINFVLAFNVSLVDRGNEPFDSLVEKGTQYFNKTFPPIRGSVTDAIVNNIKAKKVIQYVWKGDKQIKTYRLYVPSDKMVYLLSFILQQPQKEFFYNKIMEEIASSFQII